MALTPNDIVHKEFDSKFRGYDADQVNDFLDVIVAEFETLIQENARLKSELQVTIEKNEYFVQLQDSLNSSIVVAQEAADRLKQNARKEAELIIFEAEREANAHVREANEHAQAILTEVEDLKHQGQNYRLRLEALVHEQLELIQGHNYAALFGQPKEMEDMALPGERSPQSVSEQVDNIIRQTDPTVNIKQTLAFENHDIANDDTYEEIATDETMIFDQSQMDQTFVDNENELNHINSLIEDNFVPEVNQPQSSESVLGETIRIELPRD